MRNRQELQHLLGPLADLGLARRDLGRGDPVGMQTFARLVRRHQHQAFQHRHLREFMRDLEGADDALVE